jgi:glycerophosphoryl diester phosphodiesterase
VAALGSVDARRSPRTVGHRGARALAPENTLRAFEIAIARGLDMVELDVHLSRDGEVVVIHDAEVRYPDGRRVAVATLSAAELAAIDLGEGQGVPRLVDAFALARGRIGVYVELKGPRTGAALGALVRAGAADGVELVSGSFLTALVAELREAAPKVPRSVLFHRTPTSEMIATCAAVGAAYAHPCFRPLDAPLVDALHAAGLIVMAPHTNDVAEARAFAAAGIDVLATDDPGVLARSAVSS